LFHVNAQVVGILSTLVAGASLVVEDRFRRSEFWATAEELAVTWLNLVPAILGLLGNEPPPGRAVTDGVRFARSASAPLPGAVRERFEETAGIGVLETYGMTEAASQIAANPMCEAERRPDSVGRPVGVSVRIVADDGHEASTDEIGSLEICGPDVIEFYLGPGRSRLAARNAAGWLPTGDLGRRDADGYLYLSGRSDDVINRGGEKTYPREVEDVLLRDPRVASAVVIGRPHALLGAEVIAFVEPCQHLDETGAETLSDELLAECGRSLSRHKRPSSLFVVDSLPTGPTGKVVRRRLQTAATAMAVQQRSDR
jgi:acyl-CoA synthetase (AMP-forming)/AMP-acid ligase II